MKDKHENPQTLRAARSTLLRKLPAAPTYVLTCFHNLPGLMLHFPVGSLQTTQASNKFMWNLTFSAEAQELVSVLRLLCSPCSETGESALANRTAQGGGDRFHSMLRSACLQRVSAAQSGSHLNKKKHVQQPCFRLAPFQASCFPCFLSHCPTNRILQLLIFKMNSNTYLCNEAQPLSSYSFSLSLPTSVIRNLERTALIWRSINPRT